VTATATPPSTPSPDEYVPLTKPGRTWVKLLLITLSLLVLAPWAYLWFFASDKGVYQLDDANWRVQAKPVCEAAQAERGTLVNKTGGRITNPTREQMTQRADIVDKATTIIDKMVTDIVAIPVATDRDRELLRIFEENYRIVIKDRLRYTASLRAGNPVQFSETVVAGGPVSMVVADFTAGVKGNDVPACSPPDELGGEIR
jgi:hypothetical protein